MKKQWLILLTALWITGCQAAGGPAVGGPSAGGPAAGTDGGSQEQTAQGGSLAPADSENGAVTENPETLDPSGGSGESAGNQAETAGLTAPPVLRFHDALSSTYEWFEAASGSYSWNWEQENGEMAAVVACGTAPLDQAKDREYLEIPRYQRLDEVAYGISADPQPDEILAVEYAASDLGNLDAEPLSQQTYQKNELVMLRPDRVYHLTARWDEDQLSSRGFFGEAEYTVVTRTAGKKTSSEDQELAEETKVWCGTYFLAGNYGWQLELQPFSQQPLSQQHRDRLTVALMKMVEGSMVRSIQEVYELDYEPGTAVYTMTGERNAWAHRNAGGEAADGSSLKLTFQEDGTIQAELTGAGPEEALSAEVSGTYYSADTLFCPEALARPVNAADTNGMTKEELKRLRNQYYAVMGRAFNSPELSAYFRQQPWYRETISPEQFSEDRLCGLFRRNIAFLKEQEAVRADGDAAAYQEAWKALPQAPYQSLLTDPGEIYVTFSADAAKAVNRGIYYEAPGEIYLPVTLSAEEYERVMEQGGKAVVTLNALTGEQAEAVRCDNPDHGDCELTALGDVGDEEWKLGDYHLSYEPVTGRYTLWRNSADTLFCQVYEGPICVLKGAEEEYGNYFSMDIDRSVRVPGMFRTIRYETEDVGNTSDYSGNKPVFDEKGYLKALYYFGD